MSVAPIRGKITGNGNLLAVAEAFRQLPEKFILQDVKAVQRECWEMVRKAAIAKAPEDTGRLKEMIQMKVGYSKKNKMVFAMIGLRRIGKKERHKIKDIKQFGRQVTRTEKIKSDDGEVILTRKVKVLRGPTTKELNALEYDAYYGVFVEFGTEKQSAQPFMRPAFDENFHSVFTRYGEILRTKVEKRIVQLKPKLQQRKVA